MIIVVFENLDERAILEEMKDETLIKVARMGDRDAFGELVRRYRNKAINWANTLAKDKQLAEDIVQDALIKAFLHMGNLIDDSRFAPWLKKIVQNQALMKFRGNSPYKKEQLFTHVEIQTVVNQAVDVFDIIHHLTQNVSGGIQSSFGNPEALMIKKDILEGIRDLLCCLSKREREVFEAYFFQEITPNEIAQLFNVSVGNIYTTISRIRFKLRRERTQIYLNGYIKKHLNKGMAKQRILAKPRI
ncbi:RNA polymerase sigma factor [Radiobacillus deserti]|uniref:RNA polymerase sigma factor n=1 Tax=Radiobacillus deserti TaxID=2594883 RepID=A0A516KDI3_9BACI|nr:RNA polymerase sigma factor [Radiobacillus deserti]QDP39472.1 RNA polymerase sigma factor [Radiobacillus deserti]